MAQEERKDGSGKEIELSWHLRGTWRWTGRGAEGGIQSTWGNSWAVQLIHLCLPFFACNVGWAGAAGRTEGF